MLFVKTVRDFRLKICYLKKKLKYLKKKKKLKEELKSSNVYAGSLISGYFLYDNFITDEKLFKARTGLEVEKFKILYEYLDPGENCENINTMNLQNKEEDRSDVCLHQVFCHTRQNQYLN